MRVNEALVLVLFAAAAPARAEDPNAPDWKGFTPLMYAAEKGDLASVRALLDKGADTHVKRKPPEPNLKDGRTALMFAAAGHKTEVVKLLLERGAGAYQIDDQHKSALHYATSGGFPDITALLLPKDEEPDRADDDGQTPLTNSAWNGDLESLKLLLAKKGVVNVLHEQKNGDTALHLAAFKGHNQVVTYLLEHGAKVDQAPYPKRWTPLMVACKAGKMDTVELLVSTGANVNAVSDDEWTPLIVAARYGNAALGRYLIDHGAKLDYADKDGMNAVFVAAANKQKDVLKVLLESGGRMLKTKL